MQTKLRISLIASTVNQASQFCIQTNTVPSGIIPIQTRSILNPKHIPTKHQKNKQGKIRVQTTNYKMKYILYNQSK